jgi:hypothetical protein
MVHRRMIKNENARPEWGFQAADSFAEGRRLTDDA